MQQKFQCIYRTLAEVIIAMGHCATKRILVIGSLKESPPSVRWRNACFLAQRQRDMQIPKQQTHKWGSELAHDALPVKSSR